MNKGEYKGGRVAAPEWIVEGAPLTGSARGGGARSSKRGTVPGERGRSNG